MVCRIIYGGSKKYKNKENENDKEDTIKEKLKKYAVQERKECERRE